LRTGSVHPRWRPEILETSLEVIDQMPDGDQYGAATAARTPWPLRLTRRR
jgi:hypothetical protein